MRFSGRRLIAISPATMNESPAVSASAIVPAFWVSWSLVRTSASAADRLERRDDDGDRERAPAQARSARMLAPDSSAFGMKPRAPQAGISSP